MEILGFSKEQAEEIRTALRDFRGKTQVSAVVLVHVSGQVVFSSTLESMPVELLGALMAGIFAAVKEFFRLSGLEDASTLLVEGKEVSVFSFRLNQQFFAFAVFRTRDVRMGVLKLAVAQIKKRLQPLLEGVSMREVVTGFLSKKTDEDVVSQADGVGEAPPSAGIDELVNLLREEIERGLKE